MAKSVVFIFILAISFFLWETTDSAVAENAVRICSQNLARVGKAPFGRKAESISMQQSKLVGRFLNARCDIIAVQEVYGRSKNIAESLLRDLTEKLAEAANDDFKSIVGESEYDEIRNGYIFRSRVGRVIFEKSPEERNLPKLSPLQRARKSTRQPFALAFDLAGTSTDLLLINIHLKSKVGGYKDQTGTEYETLRMESSEQTREFAAALSRTFRTPLAVIILGDRNSRADSATDDILSGRLRLSDFQRGASCRLDSYLEPDCEGNARHSASYIPLVHAAFPRLGSTKYQGAEELIDEIYLDESYVLLAKSKRQELNTGIEGKFFEGSDHKLIWVNLPLLKKD